MIMIIINRIKPTFYLEIKRVESLLIRGAVS